MGKDLILNELNSALQEYHNGNNQKGSYNCLFTPLQKANKILINEGIFIFPKLKKERNIPENKNPNYYLKNLTLKTIKPRNIVWEDNLGLVGIVAGKYNSKLCDITFDELMSEGNFGLLKAIAKFKPHLNVPFPHYALRLINQHMAKYIHQYLGIIKLYVNFPFDYKNLKHLKNSFKEKFHCEPNDEELAEFMNKPVEYVKNMKIYKKNLSNLRSLNYLIFRDNEEIEIIDDVIDSYSSSFENSVINKIIFDDFTTDFIKEYISKIPDRSKSILLERLKGKTLEYIAVCSGEENLKITDSKKVLTRERIRQLSAKGIEKIKASRGFKEFKERMLEFGLF